MGNVFISYARYDAQFVRDQLLEALRQLGYAVWIDLESIPGSVEWWNAITQSIANTSAVIVVLSPNSCASPYVAKELAHARSSNRPILPVVIQSCQLPDTLAWLTQVQWIDFTKEQFHTALGRLNFGLRYVGVVPVPPPPPPPPPKPLSQAILGNWRIDFQYQQVRYSLQLSILQGYSFTGLLLCLLQWFPICTVAPGRWTSRTRCSSTDTGKGLWICNSGLGQSRSTSKTHRMRRWTGSILRIGQNAFGAESDGIVAPCTLIRSGPE